MKSVHEPRHTYNYYKTDFETEMKRITTEYLSSKNKTTLVSSGEIKSIQNVKNYIFRICAKQFK